jgi:translin
MSEAGSEMRRFVLDMVRRGEVAAAEPYLAFMDEVYSQLITVDFPDAVTDGLRRSTDVLRSVLERTRGDLTLAIRQDQMRQALISFEANLDRHLGTQFAHDGLLESALLELPGDGDEAL